MKKTTKSNPLKYFNDALDKRKGGMVKSLVKAQSGWGMQKATNNPDSAVTTVRQVNTKQGPRFYGAVGKDDQTVRAQLDAKMNAEKDSIPAKDVEAFINENQKNYNPPKYIQDGKFVKKSGGQTKSKKKK